MSKTKREKAYFKSSEFINIQKDLYGGYNNHIGLYRPKDLSIEDASEAATEKLLKLIPRINKSTRILVLNSGWGSSAFYTLSKKECKVDCLNYDKEQNTLLQKKVDDLEEKLQKKFNLEQGYFEDIPYPGDTFDLIIAQDALHLSTDKLRVFREIHRTLKPEGRFIFSDILRSENCSEENIEDSLPSLEIYSVEQYEKLARKTFMHKVYLLELPEQLKIHYQKVADRLKADEKKLVKKYDKKAIKKYSDSTQAWLDMAEKDCLDWGIFIFQKLND